jgi:hypothetical protein
MLDTVGCSHDAIDWCSEDSVWVAKQLEKKGNHGELTLLLRDGLVGGSVCRYLYHDPRPCD